MRNFKCWSDYYFDQITMTY